MKELLEQAFGDQTLIVSPPIDSVMSSRRGLPYLRYRAMNGRVNRQRIEDQFHGESEPGKRRKSPAPTKRRHSFEGLPQRKIPLGRHHGNGRILLGERRAYRRPRLPITQRCRNGDHGLPRQRLALLAPHRKRPSIGT